VHGNNLHKSNNEWQKGVLNHKFKICNNALSHTTHITAQGKTSYLKNSPANKEERARTHIIAGLIHTKRMGRKELEWVLAWNLLVHPSLLTCSMIVPSNGWKDWMKERESGLSSREGEGGQNLSLQTRERNGKQEWIVLGLNPLIKPLSAITNMPLCLIRA